VDPNANPVALPSAASSLTRGAVTGSKVWTLEDANNLTKGRWLETVSFYDDKGRVIQTQSDNINDGKETVTSRYDFSGKVLCTYQVHENPFSTLGEFRVSTQMKYDAAGRLLNVQKVLNDVEYDALTVFKNEYDELGQLKNKYQGWGDVITADFHAFDYWNQLAYEYNIRGWLKSINKDYVNNSPSQPGFSFFGEELSYDYGFNSQQYNGNIAGIKWRSYGDDEERAYGYEYDNTNRLTKADFTQLSGSAWNTSSGLDFSVGGKNGKIEYDANGNILSMLEKGWKPGGSVAIDNLVYSYLPHSNRLNSVTDLNNDASTRLGDFKTNSTHPQYNAKSLLTSASIQSEFDQVNDYSYDVNGNLTGDKNKGIGVITYNHLNLPYKIDIPGKGYIIYIYDAAGNKLQKKVHDETNAQKPDKTTEYMGAFNYDDNELQFISHEEGRFRRKPEETITLANGGSYTWPAYFVSDYFIKDHLGNVRAIYTNELGTDNYPAATMEEANAGLEDQFYMNLNSTRSDLVDGYPATDPNNHKVAKVGGNSSKVGPGIMLKVMAGDWMDIMVSSWYKTAAGTTPDAPEPITDLVNQLSTAIQQVTGGKLTSSQLLSSGSFNSEIGQFLSYHDHYDPNKPKAYLNWLLFDEQFHVVGSSSAYDQVPDQSAYIASDGSARVYNHVVPHVYAQRNGYLYVYVSNETPNIPVFFDNLQVMHARGPLLEETHYYPFGLVQQGISSKALNFGSPENKIKFQEQELASKEFSDGSGLEMYEFKYRMHDPQTGRFWQSDPLSHDYRYNSPYAFSENRVTNGRELEGLEYVSIHHYANGTNGIKMFYKSTDKEINRRGGTTSGIYNSASYGPAGKGIVHYYYNGDGKLIPKSTRWDQQQTGGASDFKFHGLYSGPGSVTDRNGKYDFSFQPIDWSDAIAKRHDMDYAAVQKNDKPGDVKGIGFLEDIRTVQADRDMVQRIEDYKDLSKDVQGVETPFRTSWSGEMELSMAGQSVVISALATYKQWKIDNGYGNQDTYDTLSDQFRKENKAVAAVIDLIVSGK
jgi:RHS repeat-associated protein